MTTRWMAQPCATLNETARNAALERQGQLTKPPGALGRLEDVAVQLAAMQGVERPAVDRAAIVIYAADHGIAAENVSAFPQAVTGEMVKNFARGGAAISVLAKTLDATLEVVNLGTVNDPGEWPNVVRAVIAPSTANFAVESAMSEAQLAQALQAGRDSVLRALEQGAQLFIGGEMGIANTTSAAAVACALLGATPKELAGPGTGLDHAGVAHKAEVIWRALELHGFLPSPASGRGVGGEGSIEVLRRLGGFEIAALTGAYLACAQRGLPVLVDGYISSVAALVAVRYNPHVADWLLYAHASAEPGHGRVLAALAAQPLLSLGMRLGEGSGAAVTLPLLRLACALHNGMATFAEAAVSEKI
ncbi:MAG: nicotinate-nucleotide--dimethylbenzimidazole phosphoribosyltransferase [Gallionella sp.]|jgi:nicotinate-nucleotide--dimethylbenzimidazole phosphoribosyltransferase|nr:nicotinate-nucleotide--dimethylbenzimidazole phosphoribosyltransferase [Gallionella sp.]MCK9355320.1 nicotinate-nucleotide--dimethylbenzimidazole phosphoribosyltransferase [Gallionella sp.]